MAALSIPSSHEGKDNEDLHKFESSNLSKDGSIVIKPTWLWLPRYAKETDEQYEQRLENAKRLVHWGYEAMPTNKGG